MRTPEITLSRHIIEQEHRHPQASGEFSVLLQQISYAGRVLAHSLTMSAINGTDGKMGTAGPTGDDQKQLDVEADEIMEDAFTRSLLVAGIASEEQTTPTITSVSPDANYLLCLDPVDGSSNISVNGSLGTIFGIFRRGGSSGPVGEVDFLRPGRDLVAAGYLLFGSATVLVYTVGEGVHGFTLDPNVGEFLLTHPNMRCPTDGAVLAVNTARYHQWPPAARQFVDDSIRPDRSGPDHMIRYSGAPVADFHRCLISGGVFFYPPDADYPNGKVRTLYEAAPMAYIAEQAGGAASTGTGRVLDVVPTALHDSTPLIVGSTSIVDRYEAIVASA